jgi:hypothetical protein
VGGNASKQGPNRTRIIVINYQPETGSKYELRNVMDFIKQQRK